MDNVLSEARDFISDKRIRQLHCFVEEKLDNIIEKKLEKTKEHQRKEDY